jgi:hypothetical protein
MSKLRARLTYANVMATIAVFIALGGASFAALKLPKNSVGTKQLKKEAVTRGKVKKGTLTGAQINVSTLGTVPTADRANVAGTAGTANSLAAPEAWHEVDQPGQPQFMNGWSNYGIDFATAGFYKDVQGVVHLKGLINGSNDGTAVFFLPPGFRPSEIRSFPTTGTAATSVSVYPDGEVRMSCGTVGCAPSLEGVAFRPDS